MKADTWMPLYVADYRKKTARLTCEQHGAYLLLIMDYWVGGPLPDDDVALAQVACLGVREWKKVRPVIERYFVVKDGEWLHERVEEERERAERLSAARRDAGSKGGRPRKQTESNGKPIGLANANLEGSQNGSQNETPARVARPSPSSELSSSEHHRSEGKPSSLSPRASSKVSLIPEGFPSAADVARAAAMIRAEQSTVDAAQQAKQFRAHALTNERAVANWTAAWDGWIIVEIGKAPRAPAPAEPMNREAWAGPPDVRAAIVSAKGEAWTTTWLDRWLWRDIPRSIVTTSPTVAKRLTDEVGEILTAFGAAIVLEAAA